MDHTYIWKDGENIQLKVRSYLAAQYFRRTARIVEAVNPDSVKRSDVTRWKQGYIRPPPPYFIQWNAVTSLGENKVI